jgi:hypothetical protein
VGVRMEMKDCRGGRFCQERERGSLGGVLVYSCFFFCLCYISPVFLNSHAEG